MLRIDTPATGAINYALTTTDLNTLVKQGFYEGLNCAADNDPSGNTTDDWEMQVAVSNATIQQIFTSAEGKWTRSSSDSGSTWATWVNNERVEEDALYATAEQGTLADTALQPVVSGSGIGGGGFAKTAVVSGGAAGDITVTGIKTGDELSAVVYYVGAGTAVTDVVDLTSEFTISAADTIDNTGGTATTGGKLEVRWTKLTA